MIWTALILGFAGSLHCVGMCAPLALAVTAKAIGTRLIYNSGRILIYGLLGGVVASISLLIPLSRYQNLLSLILGAMLITLGLADIFHLRIRMAFPILSMLNSTLKKGFAKYLSGKSLSKVFLLGILNGFLPCGLTFLALSYCVILPTPTDGFTFMVLFGIATLPALLISTSIFHWLAHRFKLSQQRITVSLFMISGVLLIARVFLVHMPHASSVANGMMDIVICGK